MRHYQAVRSGLSSYSLNDLRGDLFGGVTSGILMLPIAMGFGVLTGLGPVAGLHGCIAVGLFVAIFGGTRGLIGGPNIFSAIAMALIVSKYTTTIGEALTAVMLAGAIQILLGVLRFSRFISYMPYSLLVGFFTAAGILLIVTQFSVTLGQPPANGDIHAYIDSWTTGLSNVNFHALILAAASLALG